MVEAVELDTTREVVTIELGLKAGVLWDCPDEPTGRHPLREWLRRALRTRLEPVRKVAQMCKNHIENLLTFFDHRSTNASAEAINSRIQALIHQACGYRNPARLIADIFFHWGGLDMVPRFPQ